MERKQKSLLDILEKKQSGEKVNKIFNQFWSEKSKAESNKAMYVDYFNTSQLYYYGMLPKNTLSDDFNKEVSNKEHVEQVLFRVVNADLPNLLDSFTSEQALACVIRPRGYRVNPDLVQQVTVEVNKHFRATDGYSIIRNAIKTLLISGNADVKVFIDKYTEHNLIDLGDEWEELTTFLASLDEGWTLEIPKNFDKSKGKYKGFEWKEEIEIQQDPQTGEKIKNPVIFIRGKVPTIHTVKKLIIEEIEPQDIWYNTTYGSDFSKLRWACHRIRTTVGEAEKRGFDPEKLAEADEEKQDYSTLPDMYFSRTNYNDPTSGADTLTNRESSVEDPKERPICLYEHYGYSSLASDTDETELLQVITTSSEVLSIKKVKRFPFVHGLLEQVQGQFYGRGWFDVCKPYQDSYSLATRLFQHKAKESVWNKYLAIKGQYDRQSLLNNRPGAVIEQMAEGSVTRFEPTQISETFLSAMQAMKESEQETLAQSVGIANSDGGIPQVATATAYLSIFQDSQKGAIRKNTIEQTFINPLFSLCYEICKDEGMITDPNGNVIKAKDLPNIYDVVVDTDTTHDDFAQQLQLANFTGIAAQLSQIQSSYMNEQNKFNVLSEFLTKADLDPAKFLSDPSQQQQDPHAAAEQARATAIESERHSVMLQSEILDMWLKGAKVVTEQATADKLHLEASNSVSKDQANSYAKIQKVMLDAQNKAQELELKDKDLEIKNKFGNYETILAAQKHATDITAPQVNGVR